MVIPIGPVFTEYAKYVADKVRAAGFCCDLDDDEGTTMNKKVRNAQLAQYNFIFGKMIKRLFNGTSFTNFITILLQFSFAI